MRKNIKSFFILSIPFGLLCYFLLSSNKKSSTRLRFYEVIDSFSDMISVSVPQKLISPLSCDTLVSPSSPRKECGCLPIKDSESLKEAEMNQCSTCSDEATLIGPGQRVISYAFFKSKYRTRGTKDPKTNYYGGINRNLKAMREVYPGWVMRVYSNHTFTPGDETCKLICANQEDLYWCDVSKIKNPRNSSKSVKDLHGMFWRFFPVIDPLVSIFLSRDLDSLLGIRERKAVKEWEERKDKAIHLMRDHPGHRWSVLGGMWGTKNGLVNSTKREELLTKLIKLEPTIDSAVDQYALDKVVYTKDYFPLILAHDSFYCIWYLKTECIPFPDGGWTLKNRIPFVGEVFLFLE